MSDLKSTPSEIVSKITVGNNDLNGYKVQKIFARGDEYVIYEIEDENINNRLRVLIDGRTDQREKDLNEKYIKVKPKFLEAKGLLYRSADFGLMQNRIAHTLASALSSDTVDGEAEFENLIAVIKNEIKLSIISRVLFITPSILSSIILAIITLKYNDLRFSNFGAWQVLCVLLGSVIGGTISILSGLKTKRFEEVTKPFYYLLRGFERIFLACLTGFISFSLFKSKVIFQDLDFTNYWSLIIISTIAGFSEAFIPSVLDKFSNTENATKSPGK